MDIENYKSYPYIGQSNDDSIKKIAKYVSGSNVSIKAELAASGSRYQAEIKTLSGSIKDAEAQRFSDWETQHDADYAQDITNVSTAKDTALSSISAMQSNSSGIVDSISELSGSIVAEEQEVNAAIAYSSSLLADSRADFRTRYGVREDFSVGVELLPGSVENSALSGAIVEVYDASSNLIANTFTDANGDFGIPNTLQSDYIIKAYGGTSTITGEENEEIFEFDVAFAFNDDTSEQDLSHLTIGPASTYASEMKKAYMQQGLNQADAKESAVDALGIAAGAIGGNSSRFTGMTRAEIFGQPYTKNVEATEIAKKQFLMNQGLSAVLKSMVKSRTEDSASIETKRQNYKNALDSIIGDIVSAPYAIANAARTRYNSFAGNSFKSRSAQKGFEAATAVGTALGSISAALNSAYESAAFGNAALISLLANINNHIADIGNESGKSFLIVKKLASQKFSALINPLDTENKTIYTDDVYQYIEMNNVSTIADAKSHLGLASPAVNGSDRFITVQNFNDVQGKYKYFYQTESDWHTRIAKPLYDAGYETYEAQNDYLHTLTNDNMERIADYWDKKADQEIASYHIVEVVSDLSQVSSGAISESDRLIVAGTYKYNGGNFADSHIAFTVTPRNEESLIVGEDVWIQDVVIGPDSEHMIARSAHYPDMQFNTDWSNTYAIAKSFARGFFQDMSQDGNHENLGYHRGSTWFNSWRAANGYPILEQTAEVYNAAPEGTYVVDDEIQVFDYTPEAYQEMLSAADDYIHDIENNNPNYAAVSPPIATILMVAFKQSINTLSTIVQGLIQNGFNGSAVRQYEYIYANNSYEQTQLGYHHNNVPASHYNRVLDIVNTTPDEFSTLYSNSYHKVIADDYSQNTQRWLTDTSNRIMVGDTSTDGTPNAENMIRALVFALQFPNFNNFMQHRENNLYGKPTRVFPLTRALKHIELVELEGENTNWKKTVQKFVFDKTLYANAANAQYEIRTSRIPEIFGAAVTIADLTETPGEIWSKIDNTGFANIPLAKLTDVTTDHANAFSPVTQEEWDTLTADGHSFISTSHNDQYGGWKYTISIGTDVVSAWDLDIYLEGAQNIQNGQHRSKILAVDPTGDDVIVFVKNTKEYAMNRHFFAKLNYVDPLSGKHRYNFDLNTGNILRAFYAFDKDSITHDLDYYTGMNKQLWSYGNANYMLSQINSTSQYYLRPKQVYEGHKFNLKFITLDSCIGVNQTTNVSMNFSWGQANDLRQGFILSDVSKDDYIAANVSAANFTNASKGWHNGYREAIQNLAVEKNSNVAYCLNDAKFLSKADAADNLFLYIQDTATTVDATTNFIQYATIGLTGPVNVQADVNGIFAPYAGMSVLNLVSDFNFKSLSPISEYIEDPQWPSSSKILADINSYDNAVKKHHVFRGDVLTSDKYDLSGNVKTYNLPNGMYSTLGNARIGIETLKEFWQGTHRPGIAGQPVYMYNNEPIYLSEQAELLGAMPKANVWEYSNNSFKPASADNQIDHISCNSYQYNGLFLKEGLRFTEYLKSNNIADFFSQIKYSDLRISGEQTDKNTGELTPDMMTKHIDNNNIEVRYEYKAPFGDDLIVVKPAGTATTSVVSDSDKLAIAEYYNKFRILFLCKSDDTKFTESELSTYKSIVDGDAIFTGVKLSEWFIRLCTLMQSYSSSSTWYTYDTRRGTLDGYNNNFLTNLTTNTYIWDQIFSWIFARSNTNVVPGFSQKMSTDGDTIIFTSQMMFINYSANHMVENKEVQFALKLVGAQDGYPLFHLDNISLTDTELLDYFNSTFINEAGFQWTDDEYNTQSMISLGPNALTSAPADGNLILWMPQFGTSYLPYKFNAVQADSDSDSIADMFDVAPNNPGEAFNIDGDTLQALSDAAPYDSNNRWSIVRSTFDSTEYKIAGDVTKLSWNIGEFRVFEPTDKDYLGFELISIQDNEPTDLQDFIYDIYLIGGGPISVMEDYGSLLAKAHYTEIYTGTDLIDTVAISTAQETEDYIAYIKTLVETPIEIEWIYAYTSDWGLQNGMPNNGYLTYNGEIKETIPTPSTLAGWSTGGQKADIGFIGGFGTTYVTHTVQTTLVGAGSWNFYYDITENYVHAFPGYRIRKLNPDGSKTLLIESVDPAMEKANIQAGNYQGFIVELDGSIETGTSAVTVDENASGIHVDNPGGAVADPWKFTIASKSGLFGSLVFKDANDDSVLMTFDVNNITNETQVAANTSGIPGMNFSNSDSSFYFAQHELYLEPVSSGGPRFYIEIEATNANDIMFHMSSVLDGNHIVIDGMQGGVITSDMTDGGVLETLNGAQSYSSKDSHTFEQQELPSLLELKMRFLDSYGDGFQWGISANPGYLFELRKFQNGSYIAIASDSSLYTVDVGDPGTTTDSGTAIWVDPSKKTGEASIYAADTLLDEGMFEVQVNTDNYAASETAFVMILDEDNQGDAGAVIAMSSHANENVGSAGIKHSFMSDNYLVRKYVDVSFAKKYFTTRFYIARYHQNDDGTYHYPLFKSESEAQAFDAAHINGSGAAHTHEFDGVTYYMPNSVMGHNEPNLMTAINLNGDNRLDTGNHNFNGYPGTVTNPDLMYKIILKPIS